MPATVIVGGFYGDEGKGKIIAHLALRDHPTVAARGGVGPNAGHTVEYNGKTFKLRMLPSTFVYEKCQLLIGPGVLVNPTVFLEELKITGTESRAGLDPQCSIIEESHIQRDKNDPHLSQIIKTTGTGIGPATEDRVKRIGKTAQQIDELKPYLVDVPSVVNQALDRNEIVIIEGTQGTFISLVHGTYPFVTSKDVTASATCADVGVGPRRVNDVIIVFKSFVTRVGAGPLNGEISEEEATKRGWSEHATVTGRQRRAAPFDFALASRGVMLNSANQIALTKFDVLYPEIKGIRTFEEIPAKGKEFIEEIEHKTGAMVTLIGTGADSMAIIDRRREVREARVGATT